MYNDSEKWQALVQACLSHWIDKYGLANVRKWRFTVFSMNYSRLQYTAPVMSHEDYCKMFEATYQTIKMIDPELKLGGAGCFPGIALAPDGLFSMLRSTAVRRISSRYNAIRTKTFHKIVISSILPLNRPRCRRC